MPDENVRLRIVQLLETSPVVMDDGTKAVMLQVAHKDEIEQPMRLTMFDSIRLLNDVMIALATHGYEPATDTMQYMHGKWATDYEHQEQSDPDLGSWPSPVKKRRSKRPPSP